MMVVTGTNSSEKLKSKEILDALNEAFSETEQPEETTLRKKQGVLFKENPERRIHSFSSP